MSSTALKIGAIVTLVLAVVLAIIGARVAQRYATDAEQAKAQAEEIQQQQAAQTLAVVAIKPLAAYAPIAPDAVALVPVHTLPKNYFATVDDVVGRSPLVDVDVGAPVTPRYFREGNQLARNIPVGHKAVSLEVNDVIAVGGFVRPGDIVDVLLYFRGGGNLGEPQARVLLEAVRVLAYDERLIDRPEGLQPEEKNAQERRRRQRTVVIAVPDEDSTRLMLGTSLGEVRLAMHGQAGAGEDVDAPKTDGGLPISSEALAKRQARQVPDRAVTASKLTAVEAPPAERKKKPPPPPPKVTVHRGANQEEVRP